MFTGIITDIGKLISIENKGDIDIMIATSYDHETIDIGASIACNGVCLTVTECGLLEDIFPYEYTAISQYDSEDRKSEPVMSPRKRSHIAQAVAGAGAKKNNHYFKATASAHTANVTTVKYWKQAQEINLERALKIGDELGGHMVSGHVDGIAEISDIKTDNKSVLFKIKTEEEFMKFLSPKCSVTLDGTSLTVTDVDYDINSFFLALIPHTLEVTSWGKKEVGDKLNIEIDMIARYIEKLIARPV